MSESFDLSELYGDFRDEGRAQLAALDDALSRLEREGALPPDGRAALLRALHTLKGNAGMLGLRPLQASVHAVESVFRAEGLALSPTGLDELRAASTLLRRAVERAGTPGQEPALAALDGLRLPAPATGPAPGVAAGTDPAADDAVSAADERAAAPPPGPPAAGPRQSGGEPGHDEAGADALPDAGELRDEVLRIPLARLDTLLYGAGELQAAVAGLHAWSAANRGALEAAGLRRSLAERLDALDAAADTVRRTSARLRTVSVGRLFGRFPALAADLARAQGKRLRVELEGETTELDKSTVDALAEPLLHLVRNAVDHGVEPPDRRASAGKPPGAVLRLAAAREGDMVRIEVEDDGAGLDLERVVARAREQGRLGPGEQPSPPEAAELIFAPGLSTRSEATELSGRGVGLDVVRSTVQRLRGSVAVEPGEAGGTRFVLRLPLTVALVPALFFEAAGEVMALAASDVESVARAGTPQRVGPAEVLEVDGEALPVIRPATVFGWPPPAAEGRLAVVIRRGERGAALLVERLLEQRPATLRPLPQAAGEAPGVAGATVDVDGRVVLLLDAGAMMELNVDVYRGAARGR